MYIRDGSRSLNVMWQSPLLNQSSPTYNLYIENIPTLQTHAALAFLSIKSLRKFQHKHAPKHRTLNSNSPDIDNYIQCGTLNREADYLQFTIPVRVECGKTRFAFLLCNFQHSSAPQWIVTLYRIEEYHTYSCILDKSHLGGGTNMSDAWDVSGKDSKGGAVNWTKRWCIAGV